MTSHIVIELNKMGFSTKNSLALLKKYSTNALNKLNDNIYDFLGRAGDPAAGSGTAVPAASGRPDSAGGFL